MEAEGAHKDRDQGWIEVSACGPVTEDQMKKLPHGCLDPAHHGCRINRRAWRNPGRAERGHRIWNKVGMWELREWVCAWRGRPSTLEEIIVCGWLSFTWSSRACQFESPSSAFKFAGPLKDHISGESLHANNYSVGVGGKKSQLRCQTALSCR